MNALLHHRANTPSYDKFTYKYNGHLLLQTHGVTICINFFFIRFSTFKFYHMTY